VFSLPRYRYYHAFASLGFAITVRASMHDTLSLRVAEASSLPSPFAPSDTFPRRHFGPNEAQIEAMLAALELRSLDALVERAVPAKIRLLRPLWLPAALGEHEALEELRLIARKNRTFKNYLGQGYGASILPPVIQRSILENPGWYTNYSPYQAEISQGRMEAMINFQQMIIDLTGLDIANASLLDESIAAAEAMHMAQALSKDAEARLMFVSERVHPQTIAVLQTHAEPVGIQLVVGDEADFDFAEKPFAVMLQYPDTTGAIRDYAPLAAQAHEAGALVIVAADILALTLLRPPGEFGADIAVGSTQRFGAALGFGGPHAAYIATRDAHKRLIPGRLIGVSKDVHGRPAYRLSLQAREQHVRRDKATSNICTASVLLAITASMYAVYHGPEGLKTIARRVHLLAKTFGAALKQFGFQVSDAPFFDTVRVDFADAAKRQGIFDRAEDRGLNLRVLGAKSLLIAFDEVTTEADLRELTDLFEDPRATEIDVAKLGASLDPALPAPHARQSGFLTHPVFNRYHTEHELLRYIRRLEAKDLSLTTSMVPLGSCTMKLNATSEMLPLSWPEFGGLHPFAPANQSAGYRELAQQLKGWLAEITGLPGISLEPNAGSQGEYAGLLAIRRHHAARGEGHRNICLIPTSAHGTNFATGILAGMKVVTVTCLAESGDIDMRDLRAKVEKHSANLAALMVTYPSTHGVYEEDIAEMCDLVHAHGGQIHMDGANLNGQVGLTSPAVIGVDSCQINLHKTFALPHGGGGPGVGPLCVAAHLIPFLGRAHAGESAGQRVGAICAAPFGSASLLPLAWVYIRMMGGEGLTKATQLAILNANYIAYRLDAYFPVVYNGRGGLVAHEAILDLRDFKKVTAEDVAKRLMDYGFHAPTLSWPVPGTLMVEPTESESKGELDRFCEAMISIRAEIDEIESGAVDETDNLLKNAPHTAATLLATEWTHPYTRLQAAFPAPWLQEHKFWPSVGRIDNGWGDRNLFCSCVPVEADPITGEAPKCLLKTST
jgi:glycine dehydrogenase